MTTPCCHSPTPDARVAAAQSLFSAERMAMIRAVESDHFWFPPRDRLLEHTLRRHLRPPARVLDVGCGSGRWLRRLSHFGYEPVGMDLWPEAPSGLSPANYAVGVAEAMPWADASFDAVTLLDTLEHVDDTTALAETFRVLRPGGLVLIGVPAFPALWSERDVRAGHRRRYTRRSLAAAIRTAHLELRQMFGYQFLLLPTVAASRVLSRHRPDQTVREEQPAAWLNFVLRSLNELEVTVGALARPPIGSSLIAVAEKPTL